MFAQWENDASREPPVVTLFTEAEVAALEERFGEAATHPALEARIKFLLRAAILEVERLRAQVEGHCERIAAQSAILSKRAEKSPCT